jgi:hypothetical protein
MTPLPKSHYTEPIIEASEKFQKNSDGEKSWNSPGIAFSKCPNCRGSCLQLPATVCVQRGIGTSPIVLVVVLIVGPKLFIEPGAKAFFRLSSVSDPGL